MRLSAPWSLRKPQRFLNGGIQVGPTFRRLLGANEIHKAVAQFYDAESFALQ